LHYAADGSQYKTTSAGVDSGGNPLAVYSEVRRVNSRGQVEQVIQSNGYMTTDSFDVKNGRLLTRVTDLVGIKVQELTYGWDILGNLNWRIDKSANKDLKEDFLYDGLSRVKQSKLFSGGAAVSGGKVNLTYDLAGNILTKTADNATSTAHVGSYEYDKIGAGPHAVTKAGNTTFTYDANGNMVSDSDGRALEYSTFDKPINITKGSHSTAFKYGADRARYLRIDDKADGSKTRTTYQGSVEYIDHFTTADVLERREVKRYLPGGGLVTAEYDASGSLVDTSKLTMLKDHLGSIDLIMDATVAANNGIVQQLSFDTWGQRRNGVDWTALSIADLPAFDVSNTTRGFTGHEMLDEVGLIHMNGRIYDPRLGRFMQADSFVDGVYDTQGYNRYSYLQNNPLNGTDPTGHFRLREWVGAIVAVVGAYICGAPCAEFGWSIAAVGAASGAAAAAANGGNILKGAIIGAASAAAFSYVGEFGGAWGELGQTAGFGAVGGITSVLQGGKFGHGFVTAGFSAKLGGAIGKAIKPIAGAASQFIGRVVAGGTLSEATGGKFSNGASSAAFQAVTAGITRGGTSSSTDDPYSNTYTEELDPETGQWTKLEDNPHIMALAVESEYWAQAVEGGQESTIFDGIRHKTPGVKWTDYRVAKHRHINDRAQIIQNVPSPGHRAKGGNAVYGQVDIPQRGVDGKPQWDYRLDVFKVDSVKHPGLYNMLPNQ
jgi:RHS repeat-associated protein